MRVRPCMVAGLLLGLLAVAAPARAADTATIAHIKLKGSFDEAPVADDPLFGVGTENFKAKLDRIKKAKDDAKIQGLYLELVGVHIGRGKLNELRRAITDFRKTGKKAFAYIESAEAGDYLVAAACDEVCIPESGWLVLTGVRAEMSFYKDLLEKIGVKADFLQMGAFKGAAEPLTRSSMSPELKKHMEGLIEDFYENDLIALIAESRKSKDLTPEKVKKLIDEGPFSAKAAKEAGLVDHVAYEDTFKKTFKAALKAETVKVSKNYGKEKTEELDLSNPFALFKLLAPPKIKKSIKPKIAVIYATGVIVSGRGGSGFLDEEACGSTTMIEPSAAEEDDGQGDRPRVDSPGGSAPAAT